MTRDPHPAVCMVQDGWLLAVCANFQPRSTVYGDAMNPGEAMCIACGVHHWTGTLARRTA